MLKPPSIPVLMYHGVAPLRADKPPQMDHWIAPSMLERQLAWLRSERFETLFLSELRDIRLGHRPMPRRAVVLTFDDGYLDFWLWVFPLLRKYDARATVFVTLEFVDGKTAPRRLPDDYPWGFLSWPEMREMEASGLVDVQSHAVTHTWYPTGPALVDAHRPGLPWSRLRALWWNRHPDRKPKWYGEAHHDDVPFGTPILENEKALIARRYFLNPEIERRLVNLVTEGGGPAFFDAPEWKLGYRSTYESALAEFGQAKGFWETAEGRRSRIADELGRSRQEIGTHLEKEIRFLCCPGGSLSFEVMEMAKELGYHGVSVPRWFEHGLNRPGGNPHRFYRIPSGSMFGRKRSAALDLLSFKTRVGAELNLGGGRVVWEGIRALRRLRVI